MPLVACDQIVHLPGNSAFKDAIVVFLLLNDMNGQYRYDNRGNALKALDRLLNGLWGKFKFLRQNAREFVQYEL